MTDRAIEWVDDHADDSFFIWIHYMEAHRPYGVHDENPEYLNRPLDEEQIRQLMKSAGTSPESLTEEERNLLRDLYDSDLRYCSRHVTRLFDALRDVSIWDETNVIFSSDHGEEFREHGSFFHRNYSYDELVHVPLVVRKAGGTRPDTVTEQRELLDLAPTLCALHGVSPPAATFEGRSLFDSGERRVFSLGQPIGDPSAVAVRADGWKYIHSVETRQLYDLQSDPREQDNVVADHPTTADKFRNSIPDRLLSRDTESPREPEDHIDREHLKALGYLEVRDDQ